MAHSGNTETANWRPREQYPVAVNRISVEAVEKLLIQQYVVDFPEHCCSDKVEMSQEDKQFIASVSGSVQHVNGHYYINLPTKKTLFSLPDNRSAAVQRALNLKKKLSKNQEFHQDAWSLLRLLWLLTWTTC